MSNHTPSPDSPSQSPDQTEEWNPQFFDPHDERVKELAYAWGDELHAQYADAAAQVLHSLVDVWREYGNRTAMLAVGLAEQTGLPISLTDQACRFLYDRGMIHRGQVSGGYMLPYDGNEDFHESFDARFPGVRLNPVYDPDPEPIPDPQPERTKGLEGSVYLLQCDDRYKIGITRHLEQRVNQLCNIQSPYPATLVHAVTGYGYREFEKQLHEKYHAKRVHSEWFVLDPEEVEALIVEMSEWQDGE